MGLDVIYIFLCIGFNFIILAKYDLSDWIEEQVLRKADFFVVAKFIWKDIIYHHDYFEKLVIDWRQKNLRVAEALAARYSIKYVVISAYHPQANRIIEKSYKLIVIALSKMPGKWVENLHAIL